MNIKDILSSISKGSPTAGALATGISGLQQGYGTGALAGQEMTYQDYLAQKKAMQGVLTSAAGEGRMFRGEEQMPIGEALRGIVSGNLGEATTITPKSTGYAPAGSEKEYLAGGGLEGWGMSFPDFIQNVYRKKTPSTRYKPKYLVDREDSIKTTEIYLKNIMDDVEKNPYNSIPDKATLELDLKEKGVNTSVPEVQEILRNVEIKQPTEKDAKWGFFYRKPIPAKPGEIKIGKQQTSGLKTEEQGASETPTPSYSQKEEKMIAENVKAYGRTREEVISALKSKGMIK